VAGADWSIQFIDDLKPLNEIRNIRNESSNLTIAVIDSDNHCCLWGGVLLVLSRMVSTRYSGQFSPVGCRANSFVLIMNGARNNASGGNYGLYRRSCPIIPLILSKLVGFNEGVARWHTSSKPLS
jgi:hypothetical protein